MAAASEQTYLEPRVAKVEATIDAITKNIGELTRDVRELTHNVREQGAQLEGQISKLLVSVTEASGPRKTDWHLVLGAVGLILAIGAAAFSPMMLRLNDMQVSLERQRSSFEDHQKLHLHPVGQSRLDAIENSLREKAVVNALAIKELDDKLQKEYGLINGTIKEQIANLRIDFDDVQRNGSAITRERLAVIEHQLNRKGP